jgi:hypothetical protein
VFEPAHPARTRSAPLARAALAAQAVGDALTLDRHAFSNADSWLDEYKRICRLFQTTLQGT